MRDLATLSGVFGLFHVEVSFSRDFGVEVSFVADQDESVKVTAVI